MLLRKTLEKLFDSGLREPAVEIQATPRAQRVIESARSDSAASAKVLALHLLNLDQGCAWNVLRRLKLDIPVLRTAIEKDKTAMPLNKTIAVAREEQRLLVHHLLGTEHLLLASIRCIPSLETELISRGVDINYARQQVMRELDPNFTDD